METKSIKLKKEHKDFIQTNISLIKKLDIESNLTKEKCQLIYKLYNKIYKTIENSEILNVNEINNILLNNSNKDPNIELFRIFIKIKNVYLIKIIIRSELWDPFILKLSKEINIETKNKEINHILSKGVYRLLMNSVEQFRGCWEIAEFNNNKLKKIEILEPEYFDFLKKYLETNLAKK